MKAKSDRKFLCVGGPFDGQLKTRQEVGSLTCAYLFAALDERKGADYYVEYNAGSGGLCRTDKARAREKFKERPAVEAAIFVFTSKFR